MLLSLASASYSQALPKSLPSGAKLFIAPMEWNLDELVRAEVRKNGLPVELVESRDEADFIMTGTSVKLGSRLLSPARDFHVDVSPANGGAPVWSGEASDHATFFGRLRRHGSARAARAIVMKMRNRFFKTAR